MSACGSTQFSEAGADAGAETTDAEGTGVPDAGDPPDSAPWADARVSSDSDASPDRPDLDGGVARSDGSIDGGGAGDATAGDGGLRDAAQEDGGGDAGLGPLTIVHACLDRVDDVYVSPPDTEQAELGAILRCAADPDWDLSAQDLSTALNEAAITDVRGYRISHRTRRNYPDSIALAGTARVLVPMQPARSPLPIVVINHGTVGLADMCAPSKRDPRITEALNSATLLALSFAAQGYVVIAPDYSGMGNEGVQGYGDGIDTAYSSLDAARALKRMFIDGVVSSDVIVAGHSQGAGATFEAVALAAEATPELRVVAAGAYSGQYRSSSQAPARINPNAPIGPRGFATVLSLYASVSNLVDERRALEPFAEEHRRALGQLVTNGCVSGLEEWLGRRFLSFGELLDPTFLLQYNLCVSGLPQCGGLAKAVLARSDTHRPLSSASAPILMVVGDEDELNSPAEVACSLENARADGASMVLCVDADATHASIVPERHAFVRAWLLAHLEGPNAPSCPPDMHVGPTAACR